jgi:hypothetical protein
MNVVVDPSARETFTPREITDAYEQFIERGPQYVDAETGLSASAYWFGERVLLVYEESETGLMVLIHPSAWKENSAKSNFRYTAFSAPLCQAAPREAACESSRRHLKTASETRLLRHRSASLRDLPSAIFLR